MPGALGHVPQDVAINKEMPPFLKENVPPKCRAPEFEILPFPDFKIYVIVNKAKTQIRKKEPNFSGSLKKIALLPKILGKNTDINMLRTSRQRQLKTEIMHF